MADIGDGPSLILLSAALTMFISAFLLQREIKVFNLRRLTIPAVFYLTYLLLIFFPAINIFFEQTGSYRYYFIGAVQLTVVVFAVGVLTINRVAKSNAGETEGFFQREVSAKEPALLRKGFTALWLLSVLLIIIYLLQLKVFPIYFLITGSASTRELELMREASFKLIDSRLVYPLTWVRGTIFPLLIMIAGGSFLVTRNRRWLKWFLLTLVPALLFTAISLEKAPVASLFLMLFFLFYLIRLGRINLRALLGFIGLTLAFPVLFFSLTSASIVSRLIDRLFHVPAYVLYYYFEIFPNTTPFLGGRSINKLALLFGEKPFELTNYVYKYVYTGPGSLDTGQANAAFIGDLWANFGPLGVLMGAFAVGVLLQGLHIFLIRKEKNVLNASVYAFMMYAAWLLSSTSVFTILLSNGLILTLVIRALISREKMRYSPALVAENEA